MENPRYIANRAIETANALARLQSSPLCQHHNRPNSPYWIAAEMLRLDAERIAKQALELCNPISINPDSMIVYGD